MIKLSRTRAACAIGAAAVIGLAATSVVDASASGASTAATAKAASKTSTTTKWYGFSGNKINKNYWSVYHSQGRYYPDYVQVYGNQLHVFQKGNWGSGVCMCTGGSEPTTPYGHWEIMAKAAPGANPGFALLLWPTKGGISTGGEIDIAEYSSSRDKMLNVLHFGSQKKRYLTYKYGDYTKWHRYGLTWTSSYVEWTLDGKRTAYVADPKAIPRTPMHFAVQAEPDSKPNSKVQAAIDVKWVKVTR